MSKIQKTIKILFFGDIVGEIGRKAIAQVLPYYKKKYQPDLIMANAENIAHGKGATEKTLRFVHEAGIDFFTSGNHIWSKKEIFDFLKKKDTYLIRPANYKEKKPGIGFKLIDIGKNKILVINLLGRVFIQDIQEKEKLSCPFKQVDKILKKTAKQKISAIIVDIHAEATSEKIAMGFHLDGRVSAVLGTHTHIPTSDVYILNQGTAYVTDIGMVGAKESVLGIDKAEILNSYLTESRFKHIIPKKGKCLVNAVLIEVDIQTKKALNIKRVDREVVID